MIDHLGLRVGDLARSRRFYEAALGPLGATLIVEVRPEDSGGYHGLGYGRAGKPSFWLSTDLRVPADDGQGLDRAHIAFTAQDRAAVDAFHAAALAQGGRDNGPPSVRAHYHPHYYAAFVIDPDGVNVEAVCQATHP